MIGFDSTSLTSSHPLHCCAFQVLAVEMPNPDTVQLSIALVKLVAKMSDHRLSPMAGQADLAKAASALRAQLSNLEALGRDAKTRVEKDSGMTHMKAVGNARETYIKAKADLVGEMAKVGECPDFEGVPESTMKTFEEYKDSEAFIECVKYLTANQALVLEDMKKQLLENESPLSTVEGSWKNGLTDDSPIAEVLKAGEKLFQECNAKELRKSLAVHEKEYL